ncbi:TetR family transcriptional regulator [Micromonospora sp. CA-259024]|uniref:TetR family transcriptional regulator n=1 Tax=Micromonospora sp. CA-259024 TaxID=3239965 RepID=UPI003D94E62B
MTEAPTPRKGQRTQAHLVKVAAEVFATHGYRGARMADLVSASGLTKGAFYFHFSSKEEAALAVLADAHDTWARTLRLRVSAAPPGARLASAMEGVAELVAEPGLWAAFTLCADLQAVPGVAERVRGHWDDWLALLVEVIAGDHPDADPTRVRDAAAGLLATICGLREALTGTDELRRLPHVLQLLTTGIAGALRPEPDRPLPVQHATAEATAISINR